MWIAGCRGSANAAVVILGASPGAPGLGEQPILRQPTRPHWNYPRAIGHGVGGDPIPQKGNRWGKLLAAGFSGAVSPEELPEALNRLTAIWNLDYVHEPRESDTLSKKKTAFADGAADILALVRETAPRVVFTISGNVNSVLWKAVCERALRTQRFGLPIERTQPTLVWFDGVPFSTLLIQSIRHPSYPSLTSARLEKLAERCREFWQKDA